MHQRSQQQIHCCKSTTTNRWYCQAEWDYIEPPFASSSWLSWQCVGDFQEPTDSSDHRKPFHDICKSQTNIFYPMPSRHLFQRALGGNKIRHTRWRWSCQDPKCSMEGSRHPHMTICDDMCKLCQIEGHILQGSEELLGKKQKGGPWWWTQCFPCPGDEGVCKHLMQWIDLRMWHRKNVEESVDILDMWCVI